MIKAVFRKELITNLLTYRFIFGLGTVIALTVIVTFPLVADYEHRLRTYQESQANGERLLTSVRVWAELEPILSRRPSPLAILQRGVEGKLQPTITISPGQPVHLVGLSDGERRYLEFLPDFDSTTIVSLLLALLALLLSFDAFSGEKEAGSLRMVMSHPIRRWKLLLGKYLGILTTLTVMLAMGLVGSLLILHFKGTFQLSEGEWAAMLLIWLLYELYLSLFLLIGLVSSALTHRSNLTLLAAMTCWLVLVIVWPHVARSLAEQINPLPSLQRIEREHEELDRQFAKQVNAYDREHNPMYKPENQGKFYWGMNTGDIRTHSLANNFYIVRSDFPQLIEHRQHLREFSEPMRIEFTNKVEQLYADYERRLLQQTKLARLLGSLAPVVLLRWSAAVLSGTDLSQYLDSASAARQYRLLVLSYLERKGLGSVDYTTDQYRAQSQERADHSSSEEPPALPISDLPRFNAPNDSLQEKLQGAFLPTGGLVLMNFLLLAIAIGCIEHYDVR